MRRKLSEEHMDMFQITLDGDEVVLFPFVVRRFVNAGSTELRQLQGRRSLPPTPSAQSSLPANHLPDQPQPTARLPRPVPSIPSYNPMRPLVPVSEDAIRSPAEITGSRITGETQTDSRTPVTQAQQVTYLGSINNLNPMCTIILFYL